MKHSRQEFDRRWFIGVRLVERKQELESAILEWCIDSSLSADATAMNPQKLTWTKNHRVPNHDIIRTRTSGYTAGGIARESFKVANEASPAVRRLIQNYKNGSTRKKLTHTISVFQ